MSLSCRSDSPMNISMRHWQHRGRPCPGAGDYSFQHGTSYRMSMSLYTSKEETNIHLGNIHIWGKEKERNREEAVGESEKPGWCRAIGQSTAAEDEDNEFANGIYDLEGHW